MLSDSFCQIGFSGDVHVADQSTTSIVLAWTEPLVVGAAGLRGGPTAAGNRDVDFRIQKNTHYIRYHPTMLKDSLLLYCTFFFSGRPLVFLLFSIDFSPDQEKKLTSLKPWTNRPRALAGGIKKNRRILDLRQREHHIDDSVAVPHWKRTTRTTGWHGWHRWRHQGDHSDDRFFSHGSWWLNFGLRTFFFKEVVVMFVTSMYVGHVLWFLFVGDTFPEHLESQRFGVLKWVVNTVSFDSSWFLKVFLASYMFCSRHRFTTYWLWWKRSTWSNGEWSFEKGNLEVNCIDVSYLKSLKQWKRLVV